ncbi:MAG: TRCF domain-containing protein, partial [Candidatus Binatia bacterium]
SAFFPEEYVTDTHQRLSLYKRLTSSQQVGDLALLHGEMQDRYGPPPDPVERLFEVMQIKLLAKSARLASIDVKPTSIVLEFDPKAGVPEDGMRRFMDRYQRRLRLLSPLSFELQMPEADWPSLFPELTAALQTLVFCDTK